MSYASKLKDPDEVRPFTIVWCTLADATNDGSTSDTGELQGATISTSTWTVPSGITKDSDNTSSVTIQGVTYSASTVATIVLSGGTDLTDYDIENEITTSDGRTLNKTITIKVRER
jgi:hypothetical protein